MRATERFRQGLLEPERAELADALAATLEHAAVTAECLIERGEIGSVLHLCEAFRRVLGLRRDPDGPHWAVAMRRALALYDSALPPRSPP